MINPKTKMRRVSTQSIQSAILDFLVIALIYFAAIAWGAKKPWCMSFFSAASIIVWVYRLILEARGGQVRLFFSWAYVPAFGLIALAALQWLNPRISLVPPSHFFPHTVELHTTESYLLLAVGLAALGLSIVHGFSTRQQLKRIVVWMIGLGIIESLYGLVQSLTGLVLAWDSPFHSDSAHGTLANRNHYALLLNLTISLGVGFLYKKSADLFQKQKLKFRQLLGMPDSARLAWIMVWLAMIGLGVIVSLSRTGIFAMFACVGILLTAAGTAKGGHLAPILVLLVALVIVGLGSYIGIDAVLARYENTMNSGYFEQDRIPIWRDSWRMIRANPWFGSGVGSFQWTFPAYETWEPDTPAVYAHNDYLQILAEFGVVGLGLAIWLLVACWQSALHNLRAEDPLARGIGLAALGAFTATAIQEVTDYALYTPAVAAMLICIAALNERAARDQRQPGTCSSSSERRKTVLLKR
jgi:O-antigen ligase